ncbi:zinc ribbon domain-containing protein [bacterium]|nr:zinc ribbon domain-containing protein [bacterium]
MLNNSWNCPNCGTTEITSKFCPECGTKKPEPKTWECPNCGTKEIKSKFCTECGTKKPETENTPIQNFIEPANLQAQHLKDIENRIKRFSTELSNQTFEIDQLKDFLNYLKNIRKDFIPAQKRAIEESLKIIDENYEKKLSVLRDKNRKILIINNERECLRYELKGQINTQLDSFSDDIKAVIREYKPKTQISIFSTNTCISLGKELVEYTQHYLDPKISEWIEQTLNPIISKHLNKIREYTDYSLDFSFEETIKKKFIIPVPVGSGISGILLFPLSLSLVSSTEQMKTTFTDSISSFFSKNAEEISTEIFNQTEKLLESLSTSDTEDSILAGKEKEKEQFDKKFQELEQLRHTVNDSVEGIRELIFEMNPEIKYSELRI